MSEPLLGIVLAHAEVATALVSAVQAIVGDDHGLLPVSNTGCDRAVIVARLEAAMANRPAVIFADMAGGSCAFGASAFARGRGDVGVVTGVNLAMLVDFVFHRDLSAAAATQRAAEAGRSAVRALAP